MFAVIKSGSKQFKIEEGQTIRVEALPAAEGDSLEIKDVLLVDTGEEVKIGTPTVENAVVTARVLENGLDDKVIVFKKKRRKQYKRLRGHRQQYTALKIDKIQL
ncbi:MAG: 50S ribosomal protein L21 [Acidobacteria bacterium]|nr:50S ribosomal protein L21 [Acidobacteriota bacterium]